MKTIKMYLMTILLLVFSSLSLAGETTTVEKGQTLAGIKTELIENLKTDGLITNANAMIAMQKYVSDPNESKDILVKDDTGWRSHVTLSNAMKLLGVLLLVFAFSGMISKIIRACWIVIAAIPIIVYQAVALTFTVTATVAPALIWESQSFFVVLFGSILNLVIIAWILDSYPKLLEMVKNVFKLGIPVECVGLFYLSIYLGALMVYQNSVIFATATLFSLIGFVLAIVIRILEKKKIEADDKGLSYVAYGILSFWLAVYVALKMTNTLPAYVDLFNVGIQYIVIFAMAFICQAYTTPFAGYRKFEVPAIVGTVLLGVFGIVAYTTLGMQVAGTLIFCSYVILLLQWVVYYAYKVGVIFGSGVVGALLYGSALLVERYGSLLVFY